MTAEVRAISGAEVHRIQGELREVQSAKAIGIISATIVGGRHEYDIYGCTKVKIFAHKIELHRSYLLSNQTRYSMTSGVKRKGCKIQLDTCYRLSRNQGSAPVPALAIGAHQRYC